MVLIPEQFYRFLLGKGKKPSTLLKDLVQKIFMDDKMDNIKKIQSLHMTI